MALPTGTLEEPPKTQAWVPEGRPLTILMVEDSHIILRVASAILRKAGHTVHTASDGGAGLAMLQARHAALDLVVLDLLLPVLDGDALLLETRRLRSDLPVLMTTGWTDEATLAKLRAVPRVEVLTKPYRAVDLVSAVAICAEDPSITLG